MQAIKLVDASYGRAPAFACIWVYALPQEMFDVDYSDVDGKSM